MGEGWVRAPPNCGRRSSGWASRLALSRFAGLSRCGTRGELSAHCHRFGLQRGYHAFGEELDRVRDLLVGEAAEGKHTDQGVGLGALHDLAGFSCHGLRAADAWDAPRMDALAAE